MSQQLIGVGTAINDGTGDSLHAGGLKINTNFTELYNLLTVGSGSGNLNALMKAWFASLPTSTSGLSSGDLWNNGHTLAQVP